MSDSTVVHMGENSPEQVAFKLLQIVALNERQQLQGSATATNYPDRKWLLDTYAECLRTVRDPFSRSYADHSE